MPSVIDTSTGCRMPEQNGWWGILIPRTVVERCGLPREELFYGLEEQEYFLDRLPLAGVEVLHSEVAEVRSYQRGDAPLAPWKFYYLARNTTYRYLHDRRHLPSATLLRSWAHFVRNLLRDAWAYDERVSKTAMLVRGIADGATKRLGKRVQPDRADRPWDAPPAPTTITGR
jgi:GT2 family glycosyltransferase